MADLNSVIIKTRNFSSHKLGAKKNILTFIQDPDSRFYLHLDLAWKFVSITVLFLLMLQGQRGTQSHSKTFFQLIQCLPKDTSTEQVFTVINSFKTSVSKMLDEELQIQLEAHCWTFFQCCITVHNTR